jgi:caffeoyl-CoA O-methyltransferase
MELVNREIDQYAFEHTSPESDILNDLVSTTKKRLKYSQMLSGRVEGRLLQMLIRLSKAMKVLEVGMFTGYSALSMAEALPDEGLLKTCDTNEKYAKIARDYFDKSPHGKKIEIVMGPALETIPKMNDEFDLIFLDADKDNYPAYYDILMPKLRTGGMLVVDNALWSGTVLHPDDRKAQSIDKLNKIIRNDERVENVLLTIRDGVNLVQKLGK